MGPRVVATDHCDTAVLFPGGHALACWWFGRACGGETNCCREQGRKALILNRCRWRGWFSTLSRC
jgi:hypothetical protein